MDVHQSVLPGELDSLCDRSWAVMAGCSMQHTRDEGYLDLELLENLETITPQNESKVGSGTAITPWIMINAEHDEITRRTKAPNLISQATRDDPWPKFHHKKTWRCVV